MNAKFLSPVLVIGVAMLATTACSSASAATPTPIPPKSADGADAVAAEGYLAPARKATLGVKAGGRIVEISARKGDSVKAGQVIIKLDDSAQKAQVTQAEAGVQSAEAKLSQVKVGARAEDVTAARAAADAAKAQYDAAVAESARADANYQNVLAGPREGAVVSALATVKRAEATLKQAQANYDTIVWAPDREAHPYSVALEQADVSYREAKAAYDDLLAGATDPELKAAANAVDAAKAQARAAEAQKRQADAKLALLVAGSAKEDVAAAEAGVAQAKANLEAAKVALADTTLVAPFAGAVATLDAEVGEMAAPGVALVQLADTSTWKVDTDDLSEKDVAALAVGQKASVSVDAFPNKKLDGAVTLIAPKSETKRGEITYTVTIELQNPGDTALRWGMTAFVNFAK